MKKEIRTSLESFEQVNRALHELAGRKSVVSEKEAKMNTKINDIKDKYDVETAESRAAIDQLETNIQNFCMLHKTEFDKTRSKKLMFGTVGFRTGTPKVKLLNRKYNWNTVLELANSVFKGKYTRRKEELDKDKLLSDYAQGKLDDEKVAAIGTTIDQGETFNIEIDWQKIADTTA